MAGIYVSPLQAPRRQQDFDVQKQTQVIPLDSFFDLTPKWLEPAQQQL